MPVFNGAQWLADSIGSVRSQDYPSVELVVADDGSTDCSACLAEKLGADKVLRLPRLANTAQARNVAIEASSGEYLVFLDADDRFLPGRIRRAVEHLAAHPEAALSVCRVWYIDEAGVPGVRGHYPAHVVKDFLRLQFRRNHVFTNAATVRREALEHVGMFDPELGRYLEDYDLWNRIGARYAVIWLPEILAEVRMHPLRTTSGDAELELVSREFGVCHRLATNRPEFYILLPGRYSRLHLIAARRHAEAKRYLQMLREMLLSAVWSPLNPYNAKLFALVLFRAFAPPKMQQAWQRLKQRRAASQR